MANLNRERERQREIYIERERVESRAHGTTFICTLSTSTTWRMRENCKDRGAREKVIKEMRAQLTTSSTFWDQYCKTIFAIIELPYNYGNILMHYFRH